jgi:hypothetical protein
MLVERSAVIPNSINSWHYEKDEKQEWKTSGKNYNMPTVTHLHSPFFIIQILLPLFYFYLHTFSHDNNLKLVTKIFNLHSATQNLFLIDR